MNKQELTFRAVNDTRQEDLTIKVQVSDTALANRICSGCLLDEDDKTKEVRLISERIGKDQRFTKWYCLDHSLKSLVTLNLPEWNIYKDDEGVNLNKQQIMDYLSMPLNTSQSATSQIPQTSTTPPPTIKEEPEPIDLSNIKFTGPNFASKERTKEGPRVCLNSDCQAEINDDNPGGSYDCSRCKEMIKQRLEGGWIMTSRGSWIKKGEQETTPPVQDVQTLRSELERAKKELLENTNKEHSAKSEDEAKHFEIPLRKVGDQPGDEKIVEFAKGEIQKQKEEKPSSIRPATEEEIAEAIAKVVSEEKKTTVEKKPVSNLKSDWSLLTEEEMTTLDSKQRWNLRASRQRKLAKGMTLEEVINAPSGTRTVKKSPPEIKEEPKLILDPSGTEETGVKTADEEFKELVEQKICLHLKNRFWKHFNRKTLPHLDKNTQWFFYTNLVKNDKCLCECLNHIRQTKSVRETFGNTNYREMYLELKKTKEISDKEFRTKLNGSNKTIRNLREALHKKDNENTRIIKYLELIHRNAKKDWIKISKFYTAYQLEKEQKNKQNGNGKIQIENN